MWKSADNPSRRIAGSRSSWKYPEDMDRDMIPLCNAINSLRGARTFFCCSGHGRGKDEFYILLGTRNMKTLRRIVKAFDMYGIRRLPSGFSFYLIETDTSFWTLRRSEIGVRISNKWVSGLGDLERKREFARVARRLRTAYD